MKDFFKNYKYLIYVGIMVVICLLPSFFFFFYKERTYIDAGLLFTALFFIIFVIPIYNNFSRHLEYKKEQASEK